MKQLQETLRKQQDSRESLQADVAQLSSSCMDKSQEIGNQQAAIKQRKESLTRCDRQAARLSALADALLCMQLLCMGLICLSSTVCVEHSEDMTGLTLQMISVRQAWHVVLKELSHRS